jgi:hypothetical protein
VRLPGTEKGAIAETAMTAEAVRLGLVVRRPVVEGRRCDRVFDGSSPAATSPTSGSRRPGTTKAWV